MRRALTVAASASARDVPVGAVVLDADGSVLAGGKRAGGHGDPTAHAEMLALREAASALGQWRLTGCTLVVTLEPCTMCAGALVLARVDRIVYGAVDPKGGAVGLALGRGQGPPSQPPPRGRRGRAGRRVRARSSPSSSLLAGCASYSGYPVSCSAVESPSGRGRTPRKRVMGQPIRGFKSHLHRHPPQAARRPSGDTRRPRGAARSIRSGPAGAVASRRSERPAGSSVRKTKRAG